MLVNLPDVKLDCDSPPTRNCRRIEKIRLAFAS